VTSLKLSPQTKDAFALCLQNRPEILFAILYGSAAEGLPFQDLDIGLFVDRASVPASAEMDYAFALAMSWSRLHRTP
jgi:predicted nucleotidyltransferase